MRVHSSAYLTTSMSTRGLEIIEKKKLPELGELDVPLSKLEHFQNFKLDRGLLFVYVLQACGQIVLPHEYLVLAGYMAISTESIQTALCQKQ